MTLTQAEVLAHAREIFGTEAKTQSWLTEPNQFFLGLSPLAFMTSGGDLQEVWNELDRIDQGVY